MALDLVVFIVLLTSAIAALVWLCVAALVAGALIRLSWAFVRRLLPAEAT